MKACHRLKENWEFRRVFQRGKSTATPLLVLYWFPNRGETFRVGFSVSKKVGNAVTRNRLKRVLRDCFHRMSDALEGSGYDFVVVCRAPSADKSFVELNEDLSKLLRRAKIMI